MDLRGLVAGDGAIAYAFNVTFRLSIKVMIERSRFLRSLYFPSKPARSEAVPADKSLSG